MDFIIPPVAVKLNAAAGGGAPTLLPGQVVNALVARVIDPAHVQLALGASLIDVQTAVPLIAGSRVQLAVKAAPDGIRLVLLQPASAGDGSAPVAPSTPTRTMTPTVMPEPANQTHGASALPTAAGSAPAAALASAVQSAAVTQSGLAPLLANAAVAVNLKSLPEPVRQAVLKLLSSHLPAGMAVEADQLRRAFMRSGLFLEANLESAPATASPGPAAAALAGDLKAALVALRAALAQVSGGLRTAAAPGQATASDASAASAASAIPSGSLAPPLAAAAGHAAITDAQGLCHTLFHAAGETGAAHAAGTAASAAIAPGAGEADAVPASPLADNRPPPPYRGALPVAQTQALPSVEATQPPDRILQILLAGTEGALARQTLLQAASLPDQAGATAGAPKADANMQRWAFEIPIATPQGPAIAQFEIAGDAHGRGHDRVAPIWRARFAIDVEPLGAIHAQVAVMGERTAVTLWAERAESAALMRDHAGSLAAGLRAAELEPLEIMIRAGAPRLQPKAATTAGHFLDRAS